MKGCGLRGGDGGDRAGEGGGDKFEIGVEASGFDEPVFAGEQRGGDGPQADAQARAIRLVEVEPQPGVDAQPRGVDGLIAGSWRAEQERGLPCLTCRPGWPGGACVAGVPFTTALIGLPMRLPYSGAHGCFARLRLAGGEDASNAARLALDDERLHDKAISNRYAIP